MIEVSSDVIDKIIKIVKNGGGEVYEQEGYINLCGVRNNTTDNTFNDTLYVFWKDYKDGQFKCVRSQGFTTKPGKTQFINPTTEEGKKNGVAIVKEGWHPNCWQIGIHGRSSKTPNYAHKALRQESNVTGKMTITRDNTQIGKSASEPYYLNIFESTTETGYYFTNLHWAGDASSQLVNNNSAGCQVFQYRQDLRELLELAEYAKSKGQKLFSYFLTNKTVFDNDGVVDNSTTPYNYQQSQFSGAFNADGSISNNYSNGVGLGGYGLDGNYGNQSSLNQGDETSFGTDVIFGEVFPNDDNNNYINMPSEEIAVIQYTESLLLPDNLNDKADRSYSTMGVDSRKISYYIPVVYINDYMVPQTNITNFCLDYSSFTPQVMVEFIDTKNEILSTNVPKPGSFIKVYIGGNGDEQYYKPIRQDFYITNINKTNKTYGEYQNYSNTGAAIKYKFTGMLNIPMGFRKMPWSTPKVNARQALFNISNAAGLGFATNFTLNSDVDVMQWINTQNKSLFDFMREITQHSCYSPYTFFTSFIDQYNVLNYVECRRLLSHGGDKTDIPQMIYNGLLPDMEKEKTDIPDENLNSNTQKLSYYFLTNSAKFKGWTNYVEEYFELNDGYSIMTDGYRKTLTYSDKCSSFSVPSKSVKFLITPIDNMVRDENKRIMSLTDSIAKDTHIPLNLVQTTSETYTNTTCMHDNPVVAESRVDMGEVDTSNTYPLYYYASVQNDFQMKFFKKCGLSVRLQNYNPAITRYSRIWVDIYDKNKFSITNIKENSSVDDMPESTYKEEMKEKNDNIISFKEEQENDNEIQVYNRSLSGWYVVTDMKITYNTTKDHKGNPSKNLQTQLVLNRIDYRPSFKSEYEIAKKAIEKYKDENIPENILRGGDIM